MGVDQGLLVLGDVSKDEVDVGLVVLVGGDVLHDLPHWSNARSSSDQGNVLCAREREQAGQSVRTACDGRVGGVEGQGRPYLELVGLVRELGDRTLDRELVTLLEREKVLSHDAVGVVLHQQLELALNVGSSDGRVGPSKPATQDVSDALITSSLLVDLILT